MSKYKYYFKKQKTEIANDILKCLLVSGIICVAGTSPYFVVNLIKSIKKQKEWNKYNHKKIYDKFYNLLKAGCINIERDGHEARISLTEKGKKERVGCR